MSQSIDPSQQTTELPGMGQTQAGGESANATLAADDLARIDAVCDSFEAAWRQGAPPRLEDFLHRVPRLLARDLFRELLATELHWRRQSGQLPQEEQYLARFPEHRDIVEWLYRTPVARVGQQAAERPEGEQSLRERVSMLSGYELRTELGRGGMGVVYHARQLRANRDVALKMVLHGGHSNAAQRARFRAEAEAIARLQHPNIVAVYDVGEVDDHPFFSMELCAGGSLANLKSPPSCRAAAELLMQVSRGVAAAHAAGIVHRDLKPGNVLLTADGVPKVADFGLAKHLETSGASLMGLTGSGAVLGTPSYMAPEQAGSARRVGPAADVYSLGAILYELLTGQPPFCGPTATDTLLLLLTENVRPPRELRADVPRDLEAICLRCLDKDPGRRYPTAAELVEDLARFLSGEPVTASQSGLWDRLAGALDRVPLHDRFSSYGSLLLAMAPLMFLADAWFTACLLNGWPTDLLRVGQFGRVAAFVVLLGYFRNWRWLPHNAAERQLWTIWGSYLLACIILGVSTWLALRRFGAMEPQLYLGFSVLTAVAFFVLSRGFWGYGVIVAFIFSAMPLLMAIDLRWAPLEFGTTWCVVLALVGMRLRRMGTASGTRAGMTLGAACPPEND